MIVHQFTTYPFGGAGGAAVRHHRALRAESIESRLFVRRSERVDAPGAEPIDSRHGVHSPVGPEIYECSWLDAADAKPTSWWARAVARRRRRRICREYERHVRARDVAAETFSPAELLEWTRCRPQHLSADVLHLHWMSYLIDFPTFFGSLPVDLPIVWTLHDVNPFTGGCHYAGGCDRFRRGCGQCPQVIDPWKRDNSWQALRVKQSALADRRCHVVAPSRWLQGIAQQSPVWPSGTTFQVIGYGLDTQAFRPLSQAAARQRFGLPLEVPLIGFAADNLANPRKGFRVLLDALQQIATKQTAGPALHLVVFGRGNVLPKKMPVPLHELGFLESAEAISQAYSAVDLVVLPSLEDNLPQTGLEAMACGRPVVGFEVGGIPDFVIPGRTGELARTGDACDLAHKLLDLLADARLRQRYSAGARRLISEQYEVRQQTRCYVELYREILTQDDPRARRHAA